MRQVCRAGSRSKVSMIVPFPGQATRELVIIDAPAHGLEVFKGFSESEIGDLRKGS